MNNHLLSTDVFGIANINHHSNVYSFTNANAFLLLDKLDNHIQRLTVIRENIQQRQQNMIAINTQRGLNQDRRFLNQLRSFIEDNIGNSDLNVTFITDGMHLSRTQLHRKLKTLTGLSTTTFINTIRLKKAAQLLMRNEDTVTQIGYSVGFSDHSYFAKCFKKYYDVTPSEYANFENHSTKQLCLNENTDQNFGFSL